MKVIDSPIPANVWLDFRQSFCSRQQSVPEGYESLEQIMKKMDRGSTATKVVLRKLIRDGLVDVISVGQSGMKYYRPKNYAKQNKR